MKPQQGLTWDVPYRHGYDKLLKDSKAGDAIEGTHVSWLHKQGAKASAVT